MMRTTLVALGGALATLSAAAMAQGGAAAPAANGCYIEVPKLMAAPPAELGAALEQLHTNLRPQVEEVHQLKAELERLRLRQQQGNRVEDGEDLGLATPAEEIDLVRLQADIARVNAELSAKQAQLKLDYAAQRSAIVDPVQVRVSERAQAFASERRCGQLAMAREPDLAGLQTAGARDVTVEFVAWYGN